MQRYLKIVCQIVVSMVAVYWVSNKVDWSELYRLYSVVDVKYIVLATAVLLLSRCIAALRLHLFFSEVGLLLPHGLNLQLYYLGLFYNLCLPGGISGDAYKIYWLQKHYDVQVKDLLHATLADRLSGLLALVWIFFMVFAQLEVPGMRMLTWASYGFILGIWPLAYAIQCLFSLRFKSIFIPSNMQAILLQLSQILAVFWLLHALHVPGSLGAYVCVFLLSSLVSVLPLSIGGIGAREITFVYLQPWFGYDMAMGVALSTLFFMINVLVSLPGILCLDLNSAANKIKTR